MASLLHITITTRTGSDQGAIVMQHFCTTLYKFRTNTNLEANISLNHLGQQLTLWQHSYKALFNSKNFTHTAELSTESENTYLKQGLASIGSTKDTSFKAEVQHWSNKASKLQDEKAFDIINLASKDAASATEIWHWQPT